MSYDLSVYAAREASGEELIAIAQGCGGSCAPLNGAWQIYRVIRKKQVYAFDIDGPVYVDREDLPEEAAHGGVGLSLVYYFSVEGSGGAGIAMAKRFSRHLANVTGGVMLDENPGGGIWPRGGTRQFRVPSVNRIDVLKMQWFVSKQDMAPDVPERVLDAASRWMPEALPRRFGVTEPLQHRWEGDGRDEFSRIWRAEPSMLFWKGTRPCLHGCEYGLGEEAARPAVTRKAGWVSVSFDVRAADDVRWRADLVGFFAEMTNVGGVFFAQAAIERGWLYSAGTLYNDGNVQLIPNLVVRDRWRGLPYHPLWLAWFGPPYRPLITPMSPSDGADVHGGILFRSGTLPSDASDVWWPSNLRATAQWPEIPAPLRASNAQS